MSLVSQRLHVGSDSEEFNSTFCADFVITETRILPDNRSENVSAKQIAKDSIYGLDDKIHNSVLNNYVSKSKKKWSLLDEIILDEILWMNTSADPTTRQLLALNLRLSSSCRSDTSTRQPATATPPSSRSRDFYLGHHRADHAHDTRDCQVIWKGHHEG